MKLDMKVFAVIAVALGAVLLLPLHYGLITSHINFVSSISKETSSDPFFTYTVIKYPAVIEAVNVEDITENSTVKIGVAGQTTELNFGRIPIGASSSKILETENNEKVKSLVRFDAIGNISRFIIVEQGNKFFLERGKHKIKVKCVPKEKGNYTGVVTMAIITPKSDFLSGLLYMM